MTMTETTGVDESTLPAPVQDAIRNARSARDEVERISNRLALAANASDVVRRNYAANQLVEQFKSDEKFQKIAVTVEGFSSTFAGDELLAAAYTQLRKALVEKYGKKVTEILDAKAKTIPSEPLTSDEEAKLVEERATQAQLYKAYKSIVTAMGQKLPSDLEADITIRRGGKRGPEIQGSYQFKVEKTKGSGDFGDAQDKLSVVANTVTGAASGLNWRTADLKNFILQQLNITPTKNADGKEIVNLPDSFEVTLPDPVGKKLTGTKVSAVTASDEEDEDEGDEASESDLEA